MSSYCLEPLDLTEDQGQAVVEIVELALEVESYGEIRLSMSVEDVTAS